MIEQNRLGSQSVDDKASQLGLSLRARTHTHTYTKARATRQGLLNSTHHPATAFKPKPPPTGIPVTAYCNDEDTEIWLMDDATQGESHAITSHDTDTWTDVIRGVRPYLTLFIIMHVLRPEACDACISQFHCSIPRESSFSTPSQRLFSSGSVNCY